jgi:hypothetical protein
MGHHVSWRYHAERIETEAMIIAALTLAVAATIVACGTVSSRCSDIIVKGISAPPDRRLLLRLTLTTTPKTHQYYPFKAYATMLPD